MKQLHNKTTLFLDDQFNDLLYLWGYDNSYTSLAVYNSAAPSNVHKKNPGETQRLKTALWRWRKSLKTEGDGGWTPPILQSNGDGIHPDIINLSPICPFHRFYEGSSYQADR